MCISFYHHLLLDLSTTTSMLQDLSTTLSQSVSSMIRAKRLNETKQHVLKWSHSIAGLPGHIDTESEDNMDWNIRFTDKKVESYICLLKIYISRKIILLRTSNIKYIVTFFSIKGQKL